MDIQIEGEIMVRQLDVVAAAGGPYVAHVVEIPNVIVKDDAITITLLPVTQYPMVSGIEIFQSIRHNTATTSPTAVPTTNLATAPPKATTMAPGTNFPTASPLTFPPDSPPTRPTNASSFHDVFINCGGM
jgi:hypothetical protein